MSVEQNLPENSAQNVVGRIDIDLHYAPKQRRLAKLAYRLACVGTFAFVLRAMLYPVSAMYTVPLAAQTLFWIVALCSPCGAVLGGAVLLLFRKRTLGYRRLSVGYASAGLVVGVLASLALVLGTPVIDNANHGSPARHVSCLSNIKQLGLGVLMYAQDYDDHYPLPKTWHDEIYPYVKNEATFHCPSAGEEKLSTYAMNGRLKNRVSAAIDEPGRTVMLFESIPGTNLFGDKALFPDPLRHGAGRENTIGYVDGHAKSVAVEHFSDLIWTPQLKPKSDSSKKDENSSR